MINIGKDVIHLPLDVELSLTDLADFASALGAGVAFIYLWEWKLLVYTFFTPSQCTELALDLLSALSDEFPAAEAFLANILAKDVAYWSLLLFST